MRSYAYYQRYIIPFYLISLYPQKNSHTLSICNKMKIQLFGYGIGTSAQLIRAIFLSCICFLKLPKILRITSNVWNFRFAFTGRMFYYLYFKYITQIVPRIIRNPLDVSYSVNDWYFITLNAFYSIETAYFELALYGLLFRANMGCHFFIYPKRHGTAFVQRNYLRMLNLPIQYKFGMKPF